MTAIPYVTWRDGRPRFVPSVNLRAEGHKGHDLKHADGRWFTRGECLDWSDAFAARLETDRKAEKDRQQKERKEALRRAERERRAQAAASPARAPQPALPVDTGPKSYPVCQLWHDWLNSPRTSLLKQRTIHNYRALGRVLEDHDPDLWASEVAALDAPICNGLYEEIWKERGQATANNVLTAIGAAISWGILSGKVRGLNGGNPAQSLRKRTLKPRIRFATREEVDALVEAADKLNLFEIGDSIILGVWQGQRQGDRLAMRSPTMLGNVTSMQQGKTGAKVAIPAAPILKARMQAAIARRPSQLNSDYVILDEARWEPFTDPSRYRKLFAMVRDIAARKVQSVATLMDKDLRSTCVTWLALADCTIPQIASITGHTMESVHTILKHYLVLHPDMAATAIGKLVVWYEAGAKTDLAI